MRRYSLWSLGAVIVSFGVGACAGDDAEESTLPSEARFDISAPEVDVCGLLTLEEVAAVIGGAPSAEEVSSPAPFFKCRWSSDSSRSLEVFVISWTTADAARASLGQYASPSEVEGVGDAAIFNDGVDLAFIQGTYEVNINLWPVEYWNARVDERLGGAREVAAVIISRLP